jgi:hypothetical protein
MVSSSVSKTSADSARSSLTYINNIITGASANGLYSTVIEGPNMDTTIANVLRNTYGYKVTESTPHMGTYTRFLISWES